MGGYRSRFSGPTLDTSTSGQPSAKIALSLICNDYSGCSGSSEDDAGKVGLIESSGLIR